MLWSLQFCGATKSIVLLSKCFYYIIETSFLRGQLWDQLGFNFYVVDGTSYQMLEWVSSGLLWVYDLSTFYIRCWENGNTQTHMHTRKVCIGIKYRSLHMLNMFTTELFPNLLNGELKIWAFQDNVIRLHIMNRSLKKRPWGYMKVIICESFLFEGAENWRWDLQNSVLLWMWDWFWPAV